MASDQVIDEVLRVTPLATFQRPDHYRNVEFTDNMESTAILAKDEEFDRRRFEDIFCSFPLQNMLRRRLPDGVTSPHTFCERMADTGLISMGGKVDILTVSGQVIRYMFLSTFPSHVRDEWEYGVQRTSDGGPLLLYKLGPEFRDPPHEGELRGNVFEHLMVGKDDGESKLQPNDMNPDDCQETVNEIAFPKTHRNRPEIRWIAVGDIDAGHAEDPSKWVEIKTRVTRECQHHARGSCRRGNSCTYAHIDRHGRIQNTQPCLKFVQERYWAQTVLTGAVEYMVAMFTNHPENSRFSRRAPRLSSIEHVACTPNDEQYREYVAAFRAELEHKLLSQEIRRGEVWRVKKHKNSTGFSVYRAHKEVTATKFDKIID